MSWGKRIRFRRIILEKDVLTDIGYDQHQDGFLHEATGDIAACETGFELFRVIRKIASAMGFHSFIVMRLPTTGAMKLNESILLSNWNPELLRAYDQLGLLNGSKIIRQLKESVVPFTYNLAHVNENRGDGNDQVAVELFKTFDHMEGAYVPTNDRSGNRGAIGFAGSKDAIEGADLGMLSLLSTHIYDRLLNLSEQREPKVQLTSREKECLVWTAAGKTGSETATILGISEKTVNHHLGSAAAKLDTVNRAHTVAVALRMGLLED